MSEANFPTDFEILWMEIQAYIDPMVMNEKIDVEGVDIKKLKKYANRIHILNEALKKVQRYELYFSEFYPSHEEITPEEALDHHMHAYLMDLSILRDAILSLINDLGKNILIVASNKEETQKFFKECQKVTLERFDKVMTERNLHLHAQSRFLDEDNVRASGIKTMMSYIEKFPEKFKDGAVELLAKEAESSFEKCKENRCKIAQENSEALAKMIDDLFISLEDSMYRFLEIKPIIRDKMKDQKK